MQSAETVLDILRESLESPVRGNPHAGFGRGTLEKGRKAPRQRPTSPSTASAPRASSPR